MFGKLLEPEIKQLIDSRNFPVLKEVISDLHPSEIADIIQELEPNERAIIFRILPKELSGSTFEYIDFDVQEELLKSLGNEVVADILNEMSPDDRTELFEDLPDPVVKKLLRLLTPEERNIAINLLGYPKDSVGRLMTPDFVAVKSNWTVEQVISHIRNIGSKVEYIDTLFVIDVNGKFEYEITIKDLLLQDLNDNIEKLRNDNSIYIFVTDNQEKAIELVKEYDLYAIPVVSSDMYLLGIVTADDIFDAIEEENTEDMQKFGGMEALDVSYTSTSLLQMIKKRGGWLVLLFLSEMLTATAMGFFEDEIARAVILALFVPLIISSGGNSGSQAATLSVRAMALKEISLSDWWFVMRREIVTGLALGVLLGSIGFVRIFFWTFFTDLYGSHWFLIALTVFFTLVCVVLWGTFAGSMLPFVLKKFGLDPATSSAPFVATLVDVTGIVIYFSIAALFLRGTLL